MFRPGHAIVVAAVALLAFGVVMVNSAGLTIDPNDAISLRSVAMSRPLVLAVLAGIALVLGTTVRVEALGSLQGWRSPAPWILLASLLLLLAVHSPVFGREVNGARRWIALGPVGFQPSEIAKWGLPIVLAWYACHHRSVLRRFWKGFAPAVATLGVICLLIATEDLGTAVLVGTVGLGILLAAGCRPWHALVLLPPAAAAIAGLMVVSPYRIARVRAFMDPYQDPQGIGYHMLQSMSAVSGGGLAGRGLGNSVQKFGYLPEDTTDFIFAIVSEELGMVGATLAVFLYASLLIAGLLIIRRCRDAFSRLLAMGIILTVGLQALINMAVVTGSAPTKGVALPLLSSGGTGWILTAFSLGLLVAMDRAASAPREATAFGKPLAPA